MQANIYRDMTMAQVSEDLVGKEIRLAGWVENIRDHVAYPLWIYGTCMA